MMSPIWTATGIPAGLISSSYSESLRSLKPRTRFAIRSVDRLGQEFWDSSYGIAMAIGHSVWELNWRGLITLLRYLCIVKGVVRIGFPDMPKKMNHLKKKWLLTQKCWEKYLKIFLGDVLLHPQKILFPYLQKFYSKEYLLLLASNISLRIF